MNKLSVSEFKQFVSDGALVYCTNKEDCLTTIDYLESLGFPLSKSIMDFKYTENYLSVGFDESSRVITRYANRYVEAVEPGGYRGKVICFNEVPFTELTKESDLEDFDECFARLLMS